MPRHAFRLPSLHRLNTKDLAAPPTAISTTTTTTSTTASTGASHYHTASGSSTSTSSGYHHQAFTTPPTSSHANTHDSTLSPSSTTSSDCSTSTNSSSSSFSRIRSLLALRRKQSRIHIEREIADECALFGSGGSGVLNVMEPRPGVARVDGGAGGVVMGGIFEVLGGGSR
ncbi:uncharacterized protein BKCO1_4000127 [Diplodia corticola]|uniref:Uncharacterized protein n=1 Tax=Diplodia corticola TaxID=236234 RepID=A0A1J9RE25_9PEZI|nr:uncharacterized protein BKCO1_4000127 [Diplodia corticola]OJD38792.1 hypothetical protein BKCO1_4000127 [Diplodia corticola]